MTTQPAPLLTATKALELLNNEDVYQYELQALADGRTACVRVLTEDEHRAVFEGWVFSCDPDPSLIARTGDVYTCERTDWEWGGYMVCARAMGAVR